jgi:hypothetical protein
MKADQTLNLTEVAAAQAAPAAPAAPDSPGNMVDEPKIDPLARTNSRDGFQDGVLQAEAMTQSWSKNSLATMFILYVLPSAALTPASGSRTPSTRSRGPSLGTSRRT